MNPQCFCQDLFASLFRKLPLEFNVISISSRIEICYCLIFCFVRHDLFGIFCLFVFFFALFSMTIFDKLSCSKCLRRFLYSFDKSSSISPFSSKILLSQQTFVGLEDVFKTSSRHVLKTSSA